MLKYVGDIILSERTILWRKMLKIWNHVVQLCRRLSIERNYFMEENSAWIY